jgi:16S rRNA (guanine1516-N2)-methyltransferase
MAETSLMHLVCEPADLLELGNIVEHFPVVGAVSEIPNVNDANSTAFYLKYADGCLYLHRTGDDRGVFVAAREITRRLQGDFLLGRACGIRQVGRLGRHIAPTTILDATAGLGLDGLALARCGATVTLVEREPVLWALLQNLMLRIGADKITLMLDDCHRVLEAAGSFDVVYFDPMFGPRRKSALPGKRMQYLGELLKGSTLFDESLIELARNRARSRVVLKRRAKAPPVGSPDWAIKGRSVRYDVYQGALRA